MKLSDILDAASNAIKNLLYGTFLTGSAPATPPSGHVVLYAKTDKTLAYKDDAGLVTVIGAGGGGGSGVWGSISGTLTDQTDLVTALATKANAANSALSGTTTFSAITNSGSTFTVNSSGDMVAHSIIAGSGAFQFDSSGDGFLLGSLILSGSYTLTANLSGVVTALGNTTTGSGSTLVLSASPAMTGTPTVPTAAALTNTTQAASTAFVTAAVATAVTGTLKFQGATDCSANPNYPAASKGDVYVVSVAGKIGGASGVVVDVGDEYFATANNAGGTQASVGTSWAVLEHNLQGALLSANNLSDVANAGTARTNLGLATIAASGAITDATGTLLVAHGGTGAVSLSGFIFGNGTSAMTVVSSTGTGNVVLATSPTFTGTVHGAAASLSGDLTSATLTVTSGLAIDGTGKMTDPFSGDTVIDSSGTAGHTTTRFGSATKNTTIDGLAIAFNGSPTASTPTAGDNSTKVATTAYVQAAIASFDSKQAVQYCSTSALPSNTYSNGTAGVGATLTGTANGPLTIDGVTMLLAQVGTRILVAGESTSANNGWFVLTQQGTVAVSPYILTRATDADQAAEIGAGYLTSVTAGNAVTPGSSNNGKVFISVAADPFTVGTTALTFGQVGDTYAAGNGITLTGNTFSINTAVTVDLNTAQTLTNKTISGPSASFSGALQSSNFIEQPTFGTSDSSAVAAGQINAAITVAYAGTITGWAINIDAGTATVEFWKIAAGTAIPTVANTINISGVSISTGTAIRSTTVSDFTTVSVVAGDIIMGNIKTISGVKFITFQLTIKKA